MVLVRRAFVPPSRSSYFPRLRRRCVKDDGAAPVTVRRGGEARRDGNATTVRVVRWVCRSPRGGRQRARGGPVRTGRGARLDCGAPGRPSTTRRRSGAERDDTLGVGGLWWWAVGGANGAASGGTGNGAVGAIGLLLARKLLTSWRLRRLRDSLRRRWLREQRRPLTRGARRSPGSEEDTRPQRRPPRTTGGQDRSRGGV